jgi:Flp pilus assembly protein TadD
VTWAVEPTPTTGGRDADGLNTLAAAYAEAGRFPEAQAAARQAIEAAEGAGQAELAANIRKLAALYAQGRPYPAALTFPVRLLQRWRLRTLVPAPLRGIA